MASSDLHGSAPDASPVALVLIDVINALDFPQGEALLAEAIPAASRISQLKEEARRLGIPCVYANDNFGKWRSDFRQVVERCRAPGTRGRPIAELLAPEPEDYFVLKPKHSAFFATTLEVLLRHFGTRRLVLTGFAANNCVLATATDAMMRDYELWVPADCVASNTQEQTQTALRQIESVLQADVRPTSKASLAQLVEQK